METFSQIVLLPPQVSHVVRLSDILQNNAFALDFACLGSGKTFSSSNIALDPAMGFKHVVVVAPVSVQPKWEDMRKTYGVPIRENVSFCGLRSVKCKQPKHGLLHRRDYKTFMTLNFTRVEVDKVEFTPTAKYRQYMDEGLLLIVDEMQNVKNVSTQFQACQALIKPIVERFGAAELNNNKSRLLMLSGSPIDKEEQVVTLFRTLHIMKTDELARFIVAERRIEWKGMDDIWRRCAQLDPETTERLVRPYVGQAGDVMMRRLCFNLFQQVIKPALTSAMPPPGLPVKIFKYNAFYNVVDVEEQAMLRRAVEGLERATAFNRETGQVTHTAGMDAMRAITRSLLQIETAKIGTFARVAREKLESNPQCKVAICVNYSDTITDLLRMLADFEPLVLNGQVAGKNRQKILDRFQKPDTECRLLIGNASVCSTGIDLDDKHGGFPRFALISPNYHTILIYQISHRFQRMDTKSDATINLVFGKEAHELRVLNALARKGAVMKTTTQEQVAAGIVFPGDFPRWEEEEIQGAAEVPPEDRGVALMETWGDVRQALAEVAT